MYQQLRSQPGHRKDRGLWLALAICLLVLLLAAAPILWSGWYQLRYRDFISDLSNSTVYAYEHEGLVAELDGEPVRILPETVYTIYGEIISAGPGRLGKAPEEAPAAVLDYGDGSRMEFWSVKLKNPSNGREYGLFLRYTNQGGQTYAFDTDQSSLDKMRLLMR